MDDRYKRYEHLMEAVWNEVLSKPKSLWGEWCVFCGSEWVSPQNCERCANSYDKLKAQGKLPNRREAVEATREKHK